MTNLSILQKVAEAILRLSEEHIYDEREITGQDGGSIVFMMEEWDEEYNNVREILIEKSLYPEYQQKEIIKSFMKYHKISKEEIDLEELWDKYDELLYEKMKFPKDEYSRDIETIIDYSLSEA